MMIPTVHLNGTGKAALVDGIEAAHRAVAAALDALAEAAPNGRDYYPQGSDAIGRAIAEQDRKSTRLNSSHSRASRMPSSA